MALLKLGGGIVKMTGKFAGQYFRHDRFGQHIHVDPIKLKRDPSAAQRTNREHYSRLYHHYWRKILSAEEIDSWNDYANQRPFKNKIGESVYLSGFSVFVKINLPRLTAGQLPVYTPPIGSV